MLAIWVKVRVKPEGRERFLKAIEVDAWTIACWRGLLGGMLIAA